MAKRRGAPEKASVKKILSAISGTGGLISAIAVKLGVHYHTVLNYEKRYDAVKRAIEEERDRILDKAESNLFVRIKEGDEETSKWFLARKGRHRGYSEKIDTEQKGDITIRVVYEEEEKEKEDTNSFIYSKSQH